METSPENPEAADELLPEYNFRELRGVESAGSTSHATTSGSDSSASRPMSHRRSPMKPPSTRRSASI